MKIKTKSKFFSLINNKYEMLEEQVPVDPNAMAPADPNAAAVDPNAAVPPPEPPPEPEVEPLTSAAELRLITLLRKAMMNPIRPEEIDEFVINTEPDEKNGRKMLRKMIKTLNTYSNKQDPIS